MNTVEQLAQQWLQLQANRLIILDTVETGPRYARLLLHQADLLDAGEDDFAVQMAMATIEYEFTSGIDTQVKQVEDELAARQINLPLFQAAATRLAQRAYRPQTYLRLTSLIQQLV